MAGPRSATLVLAHSLGQSVERVDVGSPVDVDVVRWTETEVPITLDDDRRATDVDVRCSTCGETVVAHVLAPGVFRTRRRAWLAAGIAIIVVQALVAGLAVRASLDGSAWPWVLGWVGVLVTLPVGFLVASVHAGQLTGVPRRRQPRDRVHSFRVDRL